MSKESRRRQRTAGQPSTSGAPSGAPSDRPTDGGGAAVDQTQITRPSTSPTGSVRVGRRERPRPSGAQRSFLERNRTVVFGVAVVAIVAIVGVGLISAATQPVYACSNIWEPAATQSPVDGASPQPGYAQPGMGQDHLGNGTQVTYTYCPPASGKHFNGTATGPITSRVYSPTDAVSPQGWIHNLEHGGLVVLYRGDSDGATEAGQAALRSFFDRYPNSPICGFAPGTSVGPVFARFDEMATPFSALVWGRELPLKTLDEAAILQLDSIYGERTNPEKMCNPSPSPAVPGSAVPGSAAPSASPSAAASASPSPSAAASARPSPSPAASPAPSPSAS